MNERARSVFLCPRCGAASLASAEGYVECSECEHQFELPKQVQIEAPSKRSSEVSSKPEVIQRNVSLKPSLSFDSIPGSEGASDSSFTKSVNSVEGEQSEARRMRRRKKKPSSRRILAWFVGWLIAVGVILLLVSLFQSALIENSAQGWNYVARLSSEERVFYEQEYPAIKKRMQEFVTTRSPSKISEVALKSEQLERKIRNYYKNHSVAHYGLRLEPEVDFWNVAFEESPGFAEVVWEAESIENSKEFVEAVFVKTDQGWVLDWEQYVKYSSESWTVFLNRISSQKEGVFRVYVEEVSTDEGDGLYSWAGVKFYPPYRERARREKEVSGILMLDSDKALVDEIRQLFVDRTGRSKGFSELWKRDPRNLRRATLKLAWVIDEKTGVEKMIVKDVLADHWRSLDFNGQQASEREYNNETETDE